MDLGVPLARRMIQRIVTFVFTCLLTGLAGYLVYLCRRSLGTSYSGPLTTVFNSTIPIIVKLLLLMESHGSEGSLQQSLYLKITICRWFNTAILTKIITPFTSTISNGSTDVLQTINAILWSELFLSPALRILDIFTNLKKHFLAPRSRTQDEMNLWFQGTPYNLGERYTDFTKVLFVCFFYSALFPATFFFCGAILLLQYYADKFCLLRIWQSNPAVGPQLAVFSRRYFFSGAILVMAIVASYDWAQFPFDNVCPLSSDNNNETNVFVDTDLDVTLGTGERTTIRVTDSSLYQTCDQSWEGFEAGFPFPATARLQNGREEWMTDDQITLTNIYGWTSLGLLVLFVIVVFGGTIYKTVVGLFRETYRPSGRDAKIDFRNVAEISVYVPQQSIGAFQFPVLFCDVDDMNKEWIGWTDPEDETFDTHNLIFDVPFDRMKRQKSEPSERVGGGDGNNDGTSDVVLSSLNGEGGETEVEYGNTLVVDDDAANGGTSSTSNRKESMQKVFSVVRTWPPSRQ